MAHSQEADTAPFLPTDPSLGWGTPLHSTVYDWVALVQYSQVVLPLCPQLDTGSLPDFLLEDHGKCLGIAYPFLGQLLSLTFSF